MLVGIRKRVLKASLELSRLQMAKGTSGNLSAKDPQTGLIAITPSGISYESLEPEDITLIDQNGKVVNGNRLPSSETPMHTAIYRLCPEVFGIVHTHSVYATVFSVLNRELPVVTVPLASLGPVPVLEFQLPGSTELAEQVAECLEHRKKAALLQNHGAICANNTVEKALQDAVYLEEGAQVAYLALLAGELNPIPAKHAAKMLELSQKGKVL